MPRDASRSGFVRSSFGIYIPIPTGTGAVENITDLVRGFRFWIEKVTAIVAVAGTGSGATRTLRVLKGASTVVATGTVTLAATATVGAKVALTVTDDNKTNMFDNTDVLTVDWASGGTAFTAGALYLDIVERSHPQQRR